MNAHKNARTTPFGRAVMVRRVLEEGWSVAAVASAFEVSTRTVRKWLARFCSEGVVGLENRSSAPHLVANKLAAPWLTMVTRLRRDYRMTGEEIAERLRLPRSTVPAISGGWVSVGWPRSNRASRRGDTTAHAPASSSTSTSRSLPASGASAIASPAIGAARARGLAGSSSTSRSTTPRALRTSRSCRTRGASRSPASWFAPCAGSRARAFGSSA
jgi:transposase-like protein